MRARDEKALRKHFQSWSGGFPPDSDDQITVYVDYGKPLNIDREAAREVLRNWIEELDAEWRLDD